MNCESIGLSEEEIARAKKRTRRYRAAGRHAQVSQKKQRVARGTVGKGEYRR